MAPAQRDHLSDDVKRQMNQPHIHDAWEDTYRTEGNELFFEQAYDKFVSQIGQQTNSTALDIGCGICANSIRLAQRGYKVTAADYSEPIIAQAKENVAKRGLEDRITIGRQDILGLSFPNNSFDLVLCWGVLMHVPDAERAISELVRVVKPSGYLVIEEINQRAPEAMMMRAAWSRLKKNISVVKTARGYEQTSRFANETLFWRHANIGWLTTSLAKHSCDLVRRDSGMFSDMYIYAPGRALKKGINALNRLWERHINVPQLAYHNVLTFQKRPL
jgi:2-polyprenyl-3-methyl-5-hydroxy-6-metoxy-1,4-benzoquinol methylase